MVSNGKSSSDVQDASISEAAIVRGANNEDQYRALFSDLLKRFSAARNDNNIHAGDAKHFEAEKKIVTEVATSETTSFAAGAFIGMAAFLSLRFLPRHLIRLKGGVEKLKALNEADAIESPAQKTFQLVIEASFGLWVGWAGYKRVAAAQEGSYEMIAKIPLVEGRSEFSDGMCDEWMHIANKRIPPSFWRNLDSTRSDAASELELTDPIKPKLKDPKSFRAIRQFADNCARRKEFEKQLRKEGGLDDTTPVSIPSPGVPTELSRREVEVFVRDNNDL
mmetsp:Transcript_17391/g.49787  ORF Transcript_17391/g.49787 Transcript_17391/m.49787 type:complete len:278 (-) Transcript_17391:1634-2467(-)